MILSKNKYENIISAPIAGYTNWPMRMLFSEYKAFRIFSEMIHVREILHRQINQIPLIKVPYRFTIQLFGSIDDDFIKAGEIALNYCDSIDINCGCPVKKVIKAQGGSFWLKDLDKLANKIYQISEHFPNIVSIKIRLGFSEIEILDILNSIKNFKIAFTTIHMRTAKMMFSGKALYEYAELLNNFDIPIILNGDITTPEFAKTILDNYNCKGIMIGRAALSNPEIFTQINDFLKNLTYTKSDNISRIENCKKYLNYLLKYLEFFLKKPDALSIKFIKNSIIESRKIFFTLSKKLPDFRDLKEKFFKISNIEDLVELKQLLENKKTLYCKKLEN